MDVHPPSASSGESPERTDSLERLLEHPGIWRGRSVAQVEVQSTGFTELDDALPGRGWPRAGLIEILMARLGVGEMYLLLPLLAALTTRPSARWCAWIAPPFEPYAPALAAHGLALERLFIARGDSPEWALEQSLVSGACDVVLAWTQDLKAKDLRRLHLAAEKGRALGVLFRHREAANESSGAMLRMLVEPAEQGARVTLLKSRGGHRGSIDLRFGFQ